MGKCGNILKTEHGSGSLNGVHGTEHLINEICIFRCVFQFKKGSLQFCKKFIGLFSVNCFMIFHHQLLLQNFVKKGENFL